MKQPRAFCEVPAGLASVSLVLQGGRHCKPPVSRMGNKHGYALPILDAMGLRPGLGAESYLFCEADPDVRALLCAYTQPDLLRAVAEVLRGWADEEPRALWTRLRDERRARKAALPADQSVAEWVFVTGNSWKGDGEHWKDPADPAWSACLTAHEAARRLATGPGWPPVAVTAAAPSAEEVAGWLAFVSGSHPGGGAPRGVCSNRGETCDGHHPSRVAQASSLGELAALPWPPTLVTAQAPSAEQVAGWVALGELAFQAGNPDSGFLPGGTQWGALRSGERGRMGHRRPPARSISGCARDADRLAEVSTRPAAPTPGADLEGCIIYMDPDYVGTTGYNATMPRAEVVRLATEYAAAGALVVVSEAVAIPELTALGWEAIDIAGERRGQRRTFSADGGANEWLTMSKPPAHRPAVQAPLFAIGGR